MAVTMKQMALLVAFLGAVSFILGVIAENKKPPSGTAITGKGVVICKYPSDPSVALGYASFAFLVVCMIAGWYSLFYPYKGKHVPKAALFQNTGFLVFFGIALLSLVDGCISCGDDVMADNHRATSPHKQCSSQSGNLMPYGQDWTARWWSFSVARLVPLLFGCFDVG